MESKSHEYPIRVSETIKQQAALCRANLTARMVSVKVLMAVESEDVFPKELLEDYLIHMDDRRERALATELVMGTLRWQRFLDWQLEHFTKRPISKAPAMVRSILRTGAYQIGFLDRVPDSAAVNEAVNLAKKIGSPKHAGFINGVLRNLVRNKGQIPLPPKDDFVFFLSVKYSHPQWLVKKWVAKMGKAYTSALCEANNQKPPMVIRCNTLLHKPQDLKLLLSTAGIEAEPAPYAPSALIIKSGQDLLAFQKMKDVSFIVQDEASQLVTHILDPKQGERILDACAGTGIKTTHIAQMTKDSVEILSVDQSEKKMAMLSGLCKKMFIYSIKTKVLDWTNQELDDPEGFDRILLDAPCTGTGVINRNPDIKWRRKKKDILRMKKLQITLLQKVSQYLLKGGVLLFVTCSLEPEEGPEVIEAFLAENPGFEIQPPGPPVSDSMIEQGKYFRTWPHLHHMGGFFGALLRKIK